MERNHAIPSVRFLNGRTGQNALCHVERARCPEKDRSLSMLQTAQQIFLKRRTVIMETALVRTVKYGPTTPCVREHAPPETRISTRNAARSSQGASVQWVSTWRQTNASTSQSVRNASSTEQNISPLSPYRPLTAVNTASVRMARWCAVDDVKYPYAKRVRNFPTKALLIFVVLSANPNQPHVPSTQKSASSMTQ